MDSILLICAAVCLKYARHHARNCSALGCRRFLLKNNHSERCIWGCYHECLLTFVHHHCLSFSRPWSPPSSNLSLSSVCPFPLDITRGSRKKTFSTHDFLWLSKTGERYGCTDRTICADLVPSSERGGGVALSRLRPPVLPLTSTGWMCACV